MTQPWQWSLNWDEIRPNIVIGSCPMTVSDLDRVREDANVTATLSLQHDECHARLRIDYRTLRRYGERAGLRMVRRPIRDFDVVDMRRHLASAVATLDGLLREGRRVYVHCTAGTGRSPLVVLSYLALVERCDPAASLAFMRSRRSEVCPSLEAYYGCRQDLSQRYKDRIARRIDELAAGGARVSATDARNEAEAQVLREVIRERVWRAWAGDAPAS